MKFQSYIKYLMVHYDEIDKTKMRKIYKKNINHESTVHKEALG